MEQQNSLDAELLRNTFVLEFIDTGCRYYQETIAAMQMYSDGLCYRGYLWDCMKMRKQITFSHALALLESRETPFYGFWDIHSQEQIFVENYWHYPKNAILRITAGEIRKAVQTFPEDCYFFDDSLSWAVALTHEESKPGKRICFRTQNDF